MENKRIPANHVRVVCGDVSDMTLWRWMQDPALQFPRPVYIGTRRYWIEAEILAWLDSRSANPPTPRAKSQAAA